jgi:hypothetical protein
MTAEEQQDLKTEADSETFSPPPPPQPESSEQTTVRKVPAALSGEWEKYFKSLSDDYMGRVTEIAKLDVFLVEHREITGKTVQNPLTGQEEPELGPWVKKSYRRTKIRTKDWQTLEDLRAQFALEKNQKKAADLLARIYQYCAFLYLGMSKEVFENTDWEEIKIILDACNFRTVYSLPNSQKGSRTLST